MEMLDLKKTLKAYYQSSAKAPEIIWVPRFQFAMLDGAIEPGVLPGDQPAIARLRLEPFEEGLCVQMMHLGPYATEPGSVDRMHAFAAQQGYHARLGSGGKHHEIYLSDPRKAAPEKMKTVLRHPIEHGTPGAE